MWYMTPKNRRKFLESLLLDITHKQCNFVMRIASTWRAMLEKAAECVNQHVWGPARLNFPDGHQLEPEVVLSLFPTVVDLEAAAKTFFL